MSDLELLDLIHNKSPEELTVAEIEALRQGIAASPELRRELTVRVEMEQYLHHALASANISADEIIRRARSTQSSTAGALRQLGLTAAAIAGVVIGGGLVLAMVSLKGPNRQLLPVPAEAARKNRPTTPPEVQRIGESEVVSGPSPSDLLKTAVVERPQDEAAQTASATQGAVETASEPWELPAVDDSKASAPAIDLYRSFDPSKPPPSTKDLNRWLALVEGHRGTFGVREVSGGNWGLIEGLLRWKAPLKSGHAIRLTVWDWSQLRIHAWAGNIGVTLRHLGHQETKPWVGYATVRKNAAPIPVQLSLAATDEDRFWKTNVRNPVTLQLRHADGLLTLSHGEIRLLDIPMSIPPTEIYFEGTALIRELAMVPAAELPPTSLAPPLVKEMEAASSPWAKPAEGTGAFSLHGDGSVELRTEKNKAPAIAKLNLLRTGVTEFVCEIRDPQPGTGICLLDTNGDPIYLAAFARNKASDLIQIGSMNPQKPSFKLDGTIDKHAVPFVADRTWIKLTLASGWVKLWVSVDGRHFARAGAPTSVEQAVSGIGLYALAHPSARTICLAELVLHELDVLNQLAPVGLRERADGLATQQNIASFQEAADKLRPSGVDRLEWMRACAVGQLAMGVNAELGGAFIEWLWQESAWMKLPFDQRLRLIEQLSTMTPSWKNVDLAQRQLRHYEELGRELATLERASPYSRIAVPQMLAPLWSQSRFDFFPAGVARHEALDLALGRQWEDLQLLVTRLDFYHFPEASDAGNFYRWLASLSDRQQPAAVGLSRGGSSAEWRHPFTTELSKEGFNVLADLQVALESNAYRDACQVIGSANSSGMLGLLPDSKDPDLSVSLPATVALAMREHPRFRDTMAEQFGPLGRLRVRQAIASGNANAVEAATLQFYGTEAAAEAHLWLADRAISSGAFAAAQGHYRAARKTAPKELMTRLAASEQLAAALMGEDAGLKPFGTVQLGEVQVQANEIAGLSDQLRAARVAESAIADAPFPDPEVVRLPAPSDFDAIQRARFEGEAGRAPHDVPNEYRQRGPDWPANSVDWVAEQMHVQPLKDRVLIGNRFQLASYDPESGAMQWRAGLGGDMASAHDWPLSPMRTLATSKVAYVRRLRASGPTLAAIDLANGQLSWETKLDGEHWVVSDPALIGSTLYACTIRRTDLGYTLCLGAFDLLTGIVLRERELVELRETWWHVRDCQMLPVDESFIVTCGGAVVRCDLMGNLRWVRKRLWIPPTIDSGWVLQAHRPPTLVGNRLIVVQPCVPGVVALDLDNGRLQWRGNLTTARRILGANESQVFIATSDGVHAIDARSGKQLWDYRADLLDGALFSNSDGLLIATREPVEREKAGCVALAWLETSTGEPKHVASFPTLSHQQPFLGPMFVQKERIWALFGKGVQDPTRDLIEFVPK